MTSLLLGLRLRGLLEVDFVTFDMRRACLIALLSFLEAGNSNSACRVRASAGDFLSMDLDGFAELRGNGRSGAYVVGQDGTIDDMEAYHVQSIHQAEERWHNCCILVLEPNFSVEQYQCRGSCNEVQLEPIGINSLSIN